MAGNSSTPERGVDRTGHPEYGKLPECIKHALTEKEYAWMDDAMRARLIETETTPEWTE